MKQFTFLQEGSNRILSKVQKTFWSCTHVNSCQNYTLYYYTYLIEYFIQANLKYPRIKKIHQVLEKMIKKTKNPLSLVITGTIVNKNILHINLHILFIIYFKTISKIQ